MIARMRLSPRRPVDRAGRSASCSRRRAATGWTRSTRRSTSPSTARLMPASRVSCVRSRSPPYIIEPPDELEITSLPPFPDLGQSTFVVQADGNRRPRFRRRRLRLRPDLGRSRRANRRPVKRPASAETRSRASLIGFRCGWRTARASIITCSGRWPPRVFKANANDTVLDAILQAGLKSNSLPEKAYLVRPHPLGGHDQVYKIDWFGIKDRGDTLTNYQVFPGDRVVVPGHQAARLNQQPAGELESIKKIVVRSRTRRRRRGRRSRSLCRALRIGRVPVKWPLM